MVASVSSARKNIKSRKKFVFASTISSEIFTIDLKIKNVAKAFTTVIAIKTIPTISLFLFCTKKEIVVMINKDIVKNRNWFSNDIG